MKNLLCLLLVFSVFNSNAQEFESGAVGFEANYMSGSSSSCLLNFATGGYAYPGDNILSIDANQTIPLTIHSKSLISASAAIGLIDLYFVKDYNCVPMRTQGDGRGGFYHIDLSLNSKVTVVAKSDVPGTVIRFALGYAPNGYPGGNISEMGEHMKTISLSPIMTAYELDFSNWTGKDKVNIFGIDVSEPNATVSIEKIAFGSVFFATYANHILGKVFDDTNEDCIKQSGEEGLANVLVEASDGQHSYWGYTNSDGDYNISVDTGAVTYAITPHFNFNQPMLSNICVPSLLVSSNGSGNNFCCSDFATKVKNCAFLSIEVSSDRRRRCFTANTIVSYSNYGNEMVLSPLVKIIYPEYVKPISSFPDWTYKVGDTLIYELGALPESSRGYIILVDSVVCGNESIRGLSQCTKAIISPKTQCVSNEPAWDGSSVTVFPYCENGVARFVVQNVGLEDMAGSSAYRLYSNDTLVFQSTFQLISGNSFQVRYPANGAVIRLEADQRPSHPGRSQPRAFVEGCLASGALPSTISSESLVLSVPQDDLDEEVAISCMTILDSYDPNDKAAIPAGITDDHLVKAGTPLKYTIRFQNTGSDVAYKVVVVDTLDANLDMSTFTEIAASHAYVLKVNTELDKTVLTYTFNNINLKDSTTSEPESHGFLSFYINAKADLADGNTIQNKAEIYFDYNSAIITNTVDHTIGTYVPTDLAKGNSVQVSTGLFDGNAANVVQRVTLYPNPASDVIQIKLDPQFNSGQLIILDLSGHEIWSGALKGEITSVSLSTLSSGMYLYKVMSNGEYVGVGKLLVK